MSRATDETREDPLHCSVAADCGGCAWIGRRYSEQLALKSERVRTAIAARVGLSPDLVEAVEPCLPAPRTAAYRNRAKLAVARRAGGVEMGLHRRGSRQIVDLAPCRVQLPVLMSAMERVRRWLDRHDLARPAGPVFYIDLRESDGEGCHVTLVLDRDPSAQELPLNALRSGWPGLKGIAAHRGDPTSSYPLGGDTLVLWGETGPRASLPAAGSESRFEVPATGFFQVAPAALTQVHARICDHLSGARVLLDLYCGVGVHGIVVARQLAGSAGPCVDPLVVGIEEVEAQVRAAERNAACHRVEARFIAARVEETPLVSLTAAAEAAAILNPGRSGLRDRAVAHVAAAAGLGRLAYLSCNPPTLARDLERFISAGFEIAGIAPIDLMPQTDHVEALALLTRR